MCQCRRVAAVRPELLVLAKHARPDVDPTRPAHEWTLGVDGLEASLRLAERLRPTGIDLVISSTEPKAVESGRLVAQTLDLDWQTGHDLHEQRRHSAGYLPGPLFEASIKRLFAEPASVVFGEESADRAAARFDAGLAALRKVHRHRGLAVVAHGTVIALHLERRYGLDGFAAWKRLGTPSFVVLDRRSHTVVELVASI